LILADLIGKCLHLGRNPSLWAQKFTFFGQKQRFYCGPGGGKCFRAHRRLAAGLI
jgi:hypothetical protein